MMPAPCACAQAQGWPDCREGRCLDGAPLFASVMRPIRPRVSRRGDAAPPERMAVLGFLGQAMSCLSLFRPSSAQDTFHVRNPIWNRWLARTHSG